MDDTVCTPCKHTSTGCGKQPKKLRSCLINPIQCSWFWWSPHEQPSCTVTIAVLMRVKPLHCSLCAVQIVSHKDSFHRLICNATCSFYVVRYILYLITSLDNLQHCVVTTVLVKFNYHFVYLSVCSNVQWRQEASSIYCLEVGTWLWASCTSWWSEKALVLLQFIMRVESKHPPFQFLSPLPFFFGIILLLFWYKIFFFTQS